MKKLLLSITFLLGIMGGKAFAASDSWVTFVATSVCITTGTQNELLEINFSSGSNAYGDAYMCVINSSPLRAIQTGTIGTGQVAQMNFTFGSFPVPQHIIPPVVLFTTGAAFNSYYPPLTTLNFRNQDGGGRQIKNGLTIFKVGNNVEGTIVSVIYRKKR